MRSPTLPRKTNAVPSDPALPTADSDANVAAPAAIPAAADAPAAAGSVVGTTPAGASAARTPSAGAGRRGQNRVRPMTPSIKGALTRYRISAIVVGWGLIILCVTIVLKYAFDMNWAVALWGPIHGVLFIIYVLLAFDLAYKDRWSLIGTLKVLVSGVIPGVSFVTERWATRRVLARQRV